MSTTPPPAATTQDAPAKSDDKRPSAGTRMPSLNQLAARINLNAPTPATAGNRPRLAASLLRTSSAASNSSSTAASTADSVAVNPPSSRSASPAQLSVSPPHSNGGTPQPESGEPLTTEKVEKLNQETSKEDKPRQKMPVGYKNIPSLDAITARLAKARTLSIDGTAKPPEAETIEDPKTPGLRIKAPEHPLEHTWCVFAVTLEHSFAERNGTLRARSSESHATPAEAGRYGVAGTGASSLAVVGRHTRSLMSQCADAREESAE